MSFDYSGLKKFTGDFSKLQKLHEKFIRDFLLEEAWKALSQTKKLTPVDTGELRNSWELSDVMRKGDELEVVLFNPKEYASFVEDGHMQHARWVPGYWNSNRFNYVKGADTGMMLKEKWIPGVHMARISITKLEREIPKRYERALKQFMAGLGVGE